MNCGLTCRPSNVLDHHDPPTKGRPLRSILDVSPVQSSRRHRFYSQLLKRHRASRPSRTTTPANISSSGDSSGVGSEKSRVDWLRRLRSHVVVVLCILLGNIFVLDLLLSR